MIEQWNKNWELPFNHAEYQGRKLVHQNGRGDFLLWSTCEGPDGIYVAATNRPEGTGKERLVIWDPPLVKQYLRLVPEEEEEEVHDPRYHDLVEAMQEAIRDIELDSLRQCKSTLTHALLKAGEAV